MAFIDADCLTTIRADINELWPDTATSIDRIFQASVDSQGEPTGTTQVSTGVKCMLIRFTNSVLYNMFIESGGKLTDIRGYIINFPYGTDIEITDTVTIDSDIYKITSVDEGGRAVRKCIAKLMN